MAGERAGVGGKLRRVLGRGNDGATPAAAPTPHGKAAAAKAAPVKKAPVKKAPAKAGPAKAGPAKAEPAKAAPVKQTPAKAAPVKKAPAKASPSKDARNAAAPPTKPTSAPVANAVKAVRAPARTAATTKAATTKTATTRAASPAKPAHIWTGAELREVRSELESQAQDLRGEIDEAENQSNEIQQAASNEGSGDEADAGTKTFEREHEMSLANNSRDLLLQVERALARLDAGTYGRCENCGNPIPKPRLQAFPRATLCVSCKQREERR